MYTLAAHGAACSAERAVCLRCQPMAWEPRLAASSLTRPRADQDAGLRVPSCGFASSADERRRAAVSATRHYSRTAVQSYGSRTCRYWSAVGCGSFTLAATATSGVMGPCFGRGLWVTTRVAQTANNNSQKHWSRHAWPKQPTTTARNTGHDTRGPNSQQQQPETLVTTRVARGRRTMSAWQARRIPHGRGGGRQAAVTGLQAAGCQMDHRVFGTLTCGPLHDTSTDALALSSSSTSSALPKTAESSSGPAPLLCKQGPHAPIQGRCGRAGPHVPALHSLCRLQPWTRSPSDVQEHAAMNSMAPGAYSVDQLCFGPLLEQQPDGLGAALANRSHERRGAVLCSTWQTRTCLHAATSLPSYGLCVAAAVVHISGRCRCLQRRQHLGVCVDQCPGLQKRFDQLRLAVQDSPVERRATSVLRGGDAAPLDKSIAGRGAKQGVEALRVRTITRQVQQRKSWGPGRPQRRTRGARRCWTA
jgi:hypothetical protein